MAASGRSLPAGALLVTAGVAMVVSLGIAADTTSAALGCEPRTGGSTAMASRERVGQWLDRMADAAKQWQRPTGRHGAGHAAITWAGTPGIARLVEQGATPLPPDERPADPSPPRQALIDLPPPSRALVL